VKERSQSFIQNSLSLTRSDKSLPFTGETNPSRDSVSSKRSSFQTKPSEKILDFAIEATDDEEQPSLPPQPTNASESKSVGGLLIKPIPEVAASKSQNFVPTNGPILRRGKVSSPSLNDITNLNSASSISLPVMEGTSSKYNTRIFQISLSVS